MTDVVGRLTLAEFLELRVSSGAPFLFLENGQTVNWSEMGEIVDKRLAWFDSLGVGYGSHVVVLQRTGLSLLATMMALYKTGAVAVMPNIASTARELEYIITDSLSGLVVIDDEESLHTVAVAARDKCRRKVQVVSAEERTSSSPFRNAPVRGIVTSETPATLLYTSGTTSNPKGVLYTHGNHVFAAETLARIFSLSPDDRVLHHFPLYHTNGICQMLASLVSGITIVLRQRFRSQDFHQMVDTQKATYSFLNATQIKMLLRVIDDRGLAPSSSTTLKRIGTGGEFNADIRQRFESHHRATLIEVYGSTESISICCANPLSATRPGSCGLPSMGYQMDLIPNGDGSDVGEIALRSFSRYGIFRGYWRKPDATRAVMKRGSYLTGDLARQDDDGFFYFLGRRGEMIKRGGENISPRELEAVIGEFPGVREVAVIGVKDDLRDEVPVAFVVTESLSFDFLQLTEHCRANLSAFKIPERFHTLDSIPLLGTGKVDRQRLRAFEDSN